MRRSTIALALAPLLLAACASTPKATSGEDAKTHADSDAPDAQHSGTSKFIGQPRAAVDSGLSLEGKEVGDGWVQYADGLGVRFEGGNVVGLRAVVPGGMGCSDAAQWMGFDNARTPILQKERCVWPSDSPRHGLGSGVSGTLGLESRIFEVKKTP